MTTVQTVKKQVKELKATLKPKDETWVIMWAPPDGDEDTDTQCINLSTGESFKCKYGDYKQMLKLRSQVEKVETE